ncbi:hybrid sensor histidine kinase/response regulator transcription factor [Zobellia roscoffensis]|uniref:hybrid sensor histidine kinase/response regulator transcription factor n=1 Tax=Zobellia roscoffensis TaxID=2779508 RepID=UPI00188DBDF2|nr:hybrid sensor histidine kinase/response regulator transcription factor [Zobellia roscoffensis]
MIRLLFSFISKCKFTISFILLCVFLGYLGQAQNSAYEVGNLNDQNIITNNVVSSICKDSLGFIWVGKMDGLYKYTGYDADVYSASSNNEIGLSNPWVTDIIGDGNILTIGTKRGVNFLNTKTGRFRYLFPTDTNSELSNDITSLHKTPNGELLVGTANGLVKTQLDSTLVVDEVSFYINGIKTGQVLVKGMLESPQGILLNTSRGLFLLMEDSKKANRLTVKTENQELSIFYSIYITPDKNILISSERGFFSVHLNTGIDKVVRVRPINEQYENWPQCKAANVILEDSNGVIWIGTEGEGLFSYHRKTKQWQNFKYEINKKNVLKNDFIRALYEDESGMIVAGSDAGINTLVAKDGKFNLIDHLTCQRGNEDVSNVHSILKDDSQRLWIGTKGNGLFVKENELAINIHPEENGRFGHIRSIVQVKNSSIWVGTQKGIYIVRKSDIDTQELVSYFNTEKPSLLPNEEVYHVLEDNVGNIWISTLNGLYIYTAQNNLKKITNTNVQTILDKKVIYSMFLDSQQRLWFGTLNGSVVFLELKDYDNPYLFSQYLGKSLNFQRIRVASDYEKYFENYAVYSLSEIGDGSIMAGTNFGICKIDIVKKQIAPFVSQGDLSTATNLANSYVYGLIYNKSHNQLWASSNNGLFSFDFEKGLIENFGVKDGLQSLEFNGNAIHKDAMGNLYFGGANGLNIYNPTVKFSKSTFEPNVVLTKLYINGELLNNNLDNKMLDSDIAYTKSLTLSSKQNTLGFEFTSLHLPHPLSNSFKCKLVGVDDDWIQLRNKRSINYGNLPKGNYSFLLLATNNDGIWTETPLKLNIEILPAWYNTWYMISLWVLCVLLIAFSFIRILMKNHNKNNALRIKEIEQDNLEQLYESKLVFFTNLSHELRTPLSLIVDPIKSLIGQKEIYNLNTELFNILNNNVDRLRRLIDQIMDFRKYEYGKMELKIVQSDISETLNTITDSFLYRSNQKNIKFKVRLPKEDLVMFYDEDKIEKIVYNILSNAFKATPNEGKIVLTLREFDAKKISKLRKYKLICGGVDLKKLNNHIYIKVVDNGVGISEKNLENVFTRFYQDDSLNSGTGIGLYMVKQLTELHFGTILLKSRKNKGTSFVIILPKNDDLYEGLVVTSKTNSFQMAKDFKETTVNIPLENILIHPESLKPYSVAIIEDNDELRIYLKSILSEFYNVYTANNGREGLALLKEEVPDLVVSDIMMPEIDGLELCRQVKNNFDTSHIPVILLTAKSFDNQKVDGLKSGADVYLTKPFNREILLANIENLIRGREKLRLIFQNEKKLQPSKITVSSMDEELLLKLNKYIEDHIQDYDLTLESMASEIGVSRAQMFRKMKALTGLTPNNFIKSIRLKYAVELLESNKFQISEIAYLCGFKEPSYFSRCFKEAYGCSPKEYGK